MFDQVKKLFGYTPVAKEPEPVVVETPQPIVVEAKNGAQGAKLYAKPDPKGPPGTRIYHEYIAADEPGPDGRFNWEARVYDKNGGMILQKGQGKTRRNACEQAIAWAEKTKDSLRSGQ
jgi:hypothetical protein